MIDWLLQDVTQPRWLVLLETALLLWWILHDVIHITVERTRK